MTVQNNWTSKRQIKLTVFLSSNPRVFIQILHAFVMKNSAGKHQVYQEASANLNEILRLKIFEKTRWLKVSDLVNGWWCSWWDLSPMAKTHLQNPRAFGNTLLFQKFLFLCVGISMLCVANINKWNSILDKFEENDVFKPFLP